MRAISLERERALSTADQTSYFLSCNIYIYIYTYIYIYIYIFHLYFCDVGLTQKSISSENYF